MKNFSSSECSRDLQSFCVNNCKLGVPIICFMLAHLVVPFCWSWGCRRVLTHFSTLSASLGSKYVVSKLTAIGINCCVQFAHLCVSSTCFKFTIANGEGFFLFNTLCWNSSKSRKCPVTNSKEKSYSTCYSLLSKMLSENDAFTQLLSVVKPSWCEFKTNLLFV